MPTTKPTFPRRCTLMGCTRPTDAHHHHFYRGHLDAHACPCPSGGQPGATGENRKEQNR